MKTDYRERYNILKNIYELIPLNIDLLRIITEYYSLDHACRICKKHINFSIDNVMYTNDGGFDFDVMDYEQTGTEVFSQFNHKTCYSKGTVCEKIELDLCEDCDKNKCIMLHKVCSKNNEHCSNKKMRCEHNLAGYNIYKSTIKNAKLCHRCKLGEGNYFPRGQQYCLNHATEFYDKYPILKECNICTVKMCKCIGSHSSSSSHYCPECFEKYLYCGYCTFIEQSYQKCNFGCKIKDCYDTCVDCDNKQCSEAECGSIVWSIGYTYLDYELMPIQKTSNISCYDCLEKIKKIHTPCGNEICIKGIHDIRTQECFMCREKYILCKNKCQQPSREYCDLRIMTPVINSFNNTTGYICKNCLFSLPRERKIYSSVFIDTRD